MSEHVSNSKSAYVKAIILGYMQDKERANRRDIVEVIKNSEMGKDISDGVIAGGFKMLTLSGDIVPVDRGVYVKGSSLDTSDGAVLARISRLCNKFYADLNKACTYNVLSLSSAEKEVYGEFNDCVDDLMACVKDRVSKLNELVSSVKAATEDKFNGGDSKGAGDSKGSVDSKNGEESKGGGDFAGVVGFDELEDKEEDIDDDNEYDEEFDPVEADIQYLALVATEGSFPDEAEQQEEEPKQSEEPKQEETEQLEKTEQSEEPKKEEKKHNSRRKNKK